MEATFLCPFSHVHHNASAVFLCCPGIQCAKNLETAFSSPFYLWLEEDLGTLFCIKISLIKNAKFFENGTAFLSDSDYNNLFWNLIENNIKID